MKGMRDFVVVIGSTAIASALLAVFFDWRARLLSQIRSQS